MTAAKKIINRSQEEAKLEFIKIFNIMVNFFLFVLVSGTVHVWRSGDKLQ